MPKPAISECIVCNNCGKHETMLSWTVLANHYVNIFDRVPAGWFLYRQHANEGVADMWEAYCTALCIHDKWR